MAETSTKPYLIRALYEWCCDNGYTPYLAVAVDGRTRVPRQHVKNGEIVMNVSPLATNRLDMGNEFIAFQARFGGVAQEISVPVENVSAIYARETGHGMAFEVSRTATSHDQPEDGESVAASEATDGAADSSDDATGAPTIAGDEDGAAGGAGAPAGGGEVIAFRAASTGRRGRSGRRGPSLASVSDAPAGDASSGAAPSGDASSGDASSGDAPAGEAPAATDAPTSADTSVPGAVADAASPDAAEPPGGDDGGGGGQSRPGPRRSRLTRVK